MGEEYIKDDICYEEDMRKIFVGNISRRHDTAEMGNIAKRSDRSLKFPSKLENRGTLEKAKKKRLAVFLHSASWALRCVEDSPREHRGGSRLPEEAFRTTQ